MPICQESFSMVLCLCHTPPIQPWIHIVRLSLYGNTSRSFTPIGALHSRNHARVDSIYNLAFHLTLITPANHAIARVQPGMTSPVIQGCYVKDRRYKVYKYLCVVSVSYVSFCVCMCYVVSCLIC